MVRLDKSRTILSWQRFKRRLSSRRPLHLYKLYMIVSDNVVPTMASNDNDDDVAEVTRLTTQPITLQVVYNDLLSLHQQNVGQGLFNALWQSRLHFMSGKVDGHRVAHVNLSGKLVTTDACTPSRIAMQLQRPALGLRDRDVIKAVVVRVNGQPLEEVL